jgi:hypothetical protein
MEAQGKVEMGRVAKRKGNRRYDEGQSASAAGRDFVRERKVATICK